MGARCSSTSRGTSDRGKAGVESARLVCNTVGRRGDDRSVRSSDIASVRLGISHRDAVGSINSDGGLEIRVTNFKGTVLGVVGHVVRAAQTVVNVLTVGRLIFRRTRGIADGDTERVSTNEAAMPVKESQARGTEVLARSSL